jgi:hypothetical protein
MRAGSLLEWAQLLGVGPDDLPAQTRALVRGVDILDEAIVALRTMLHTCPDRELDRAVMQLERQVTEVASLLREVHQDVVRELT